MPAIITLETVREVFARFHEEGGAISVWLTNNSIGFRAGEELLDIQRTDVGFITNPELVKNLRRCCDSKTWGYLPDRTVIFEPGKIDDEELFARIGAGITNIQNV